MNQPMNDEETLAGLRVLMAEDEMTVAMSLEMLLESWGCDVVTAARVSKAAALAEAELLDGALLDLNLGGETAYPVAESLAARDIPLIVLTGYNGSHIQAPWQDRPRLEKPFEPDELERLMAATFR